MVMRWAGLIAAVAIVALGVLPVDWVARGPSLCPFKTILGIECYGCGMTRALACLMHFDARLALTYNRGSVVVLPLLIAFAVPAVLSLRLRSK